MIYQSNTIQVHEFRDGIVQLTFCAASSVNKLDQSTLVALDDAIHAIHNFENLQGLILCSDNQNFILGADITEFLSLFSQSANILADWLIWANNIFNRIEDLPVPTISVISGHALGGGCECILTTDFRICDQTANIGLPETKLGIIPGFGGCVRLPRLLGADTAIELITTANTLSSSQAFQIGLIDAVIDTDQLIESAFNILQRAKLSQLDWQSRRTQKQSKLKLPPSEALMSFTVAKALVGQKAGKHYPAPMGAVRAIESAANDARDLALEKEREIFIELAQSTVAEALVGVYLNNQYTKKIAKERKNNTIQLSRAAVVGAGIMGGGIAYQSASCGIPIVLKDIKAPALELGMSEVTFLLNKNLKRGKINTLDMTRTLATILPTLSYSEFNHIDLAIEAVIEDPNIKSSVLKDAESMLPEHAILATNTSTIPIDLLARDLKRPEQFCGIHFFNPVHKMPLIEIIKGSKTSDLTIQKAVSYALKLSKTPVVVQDCPGFFVNRVLFPYFAGFTYLMRDGADFIQIDKVMENSFGWPMGPAYLLDVVGIDTAHHAQKVMADNYPDRMGKDENDVIDALFQHNRFGQKNGVGFYCYPTDHKNKIRKTFDPSVLPIIEANRNVPQNYAEDTIIHRLLIPMINEVVLCLQEGIIASPQEADTALIFGLGFPAFRGGVFRYLDQLGIKNYLELTKAYQSLGPLYTPPKTLIEMAEKNQDFYPLAVTA